LYNLVAELAPPRRARSDAGRNEECLLYRLNEEDEEATVIGGSPEGQQDNPEVAAPGQPESAILRNEPIRSCWKRAEWSAGQTARAENFPPPRWSAPVL